MSAESLRARLDAATALTFAQFREANVARCKRWHPDFLTGSNQSWTGADWSNAMCGEAGETANVVKKLRRTDAHLQGAVDPERDVLIDMLADEIGDVFAYLDLLAAYYNIAVDDAVARKFNRISEREGFPERIEAAHAPHDLRLALDVIEAAKLAKTLTDSQAEDDGLWFVAQTITEAYLQAALRSLAAAVEAIPLNAFEAAP